MAPTFLGLAGLSKPAIFDGKSLVPLLLGAVPPGDTEEEEGQSAAVGLLLDKQDSLPPSVVEHMTGDDRSIARSPLRLPTSYYASAPVCSSWLAELITRRPRAFFFVTARTRWLGPR